MVDNLTTSNRKILIGSILLSILAIKLDPYFWIGALLLIFLITFQIYLTKNLILFFILSLLVVASDIDESLRIVLTLSVLCFLSYIFFKDYGFQFSLYPKLPIAIKGFILLTIATLIFSSVFSENVYVGFNETMRQIIFFIMWYIFFAYLSEEKDAYNYILVLISAGTLVALIINYSFIISDKSVYLLQTQGIIHEGGSFKNVTAAAGIFAVSIPLTFVIMLPKLKIKKALTYFLYFILLIQVVGLFLTNSRSGLIAVFISISIILFILEKKIFKKFILFALASFTLFYFVLPSISELFAIYFRTDRIFENTRYYLWDMSIRIIRDNPVWGTGPGQFKYFMYNNMPVMLGSWEESQITWIFKNAGLGESHNFFLFKTAELGLFGLLGAIFLPVIFIYFSYRVMKRNFNNKKNYFLLVGIFSLGIGLLIRSFFESTGLLSNGWITRDLPFWICFAIIIYFNGIGTETSNKK